MLFVGICALGEWFTCVFHVPDNVYRLLFYRKPPIKYPYKKESL